MIKLKEIILDVLHEFNLTPDDLKKFNRIMNGRTGVKNSIHSNDDGEEDYARKGFGYGGASSSIYRKVAPDRPYRSDKGTIGAIKVNLTPQK